MLRGGAKVCSVVVGTLLEPKHFYAPAHKLIYGQLYEHYYGDLPLDAVSVGTAASKKLAKLWSIEEGEAAERVRELSTERFEGQVLDHAIIVKRKADYRELLDVMSTVEGEIEREEKLPEEIASLASQTAMKIATNTLLTHEIISFGNMGRRYYNQALEAKSAYDKGIERWVKFGMPFIDDYTRGLRGTELWLAAGEPGVGKSAVFAKAAILFAQRQMARGDDKRVATLILSLEMGEEPTNQRLASAVSQIDGGKLREGRITDGELGKILHEWGRRKEIPLFFNFASNARASQLRALVVEAIRRENVGLVIIDHFRHFGMDRYYESQLREDEDKVKFLKESIAGDLGTAVICICHTTKGIAESRNARPNLTHMRGSYQVAAAADFVSFIHQPYMYATDEDRETGEVTEDQMEMIWEKNRHGYKGIAQFHMQAATMTIR
jgi:replicative DNA helicase